MIDDRLRRSDAARILGDDVIADDEPVDACAVKAADRMLWSTHDRLTHDVERRIHDHRHARELLELPDQLVIARVVLGADGPVTVLLRFGSAGQ